MEVFAEVVVEDASVDNHVVMHLDEHDVPNRLVDHDVLGP